MEDEPTEASETSTAEIGDDDTPLYRASDGSEVTVGTKRELQPEPARVPLEGERSVAVAGGFGFAIVCLAGGGALAFGLNDRFQCGLGDRMTREKPTRIASLGQLN